MCFGAGFILYVIITIFIFNKLHEIRGIKGSPAMFLLIAPPSVGIVSLDMFNDGTPGFSLFGEMLLGWVFMLLLLLIRVALLHLLDRKAMMTILSNQQPGKVI